MWQRFKLSMALTAAATVLATGIGMTWLSVKAEAPRADSPPPATPRVDPPKVEPPKTEPAKTEPRTQPPKTAPSRVTTVTVYQNNALVTREVDVPEGTGTFELVVNPLPTQTENSSLYSEGTDGTRVLTTRYRIRPIMEDTREEVRKLEAKKKTLQQEAEKLKSDIKTTLQNQEMLTGLEKFTGANLQQMTEKGTLNSEGIMALTKYVMETRGEKAQLAVTMQQKLQENEEQAQFTQRQLDDLSTDPTKNAESWSLGEKKNAERDAVIIVDKKNAAPGTVRLNYLVRSAFWHPQYKFRAGKDNQPIQLEYLAAIVQQSGEDWNNANLILSTAEPMLNAAPPDLKILDVAVVPRSAPNLPPSSGPQLANQAMPPVANQPEAPKQSAELQQEAQVLRGKAQKEYTENNAKGGGKLINDAAAMEQAKDLLATREDDLKAGRQGGGSGTEGPSVTYHLATRLSVPSRPDEQVIEVAKIEMAPDYFYKAVPVLTAHVYRLANLTNKSEYVLLPGEATMYIGSDFVGRATLPLVAIGEQFTAGFGVDPQLQVQRQMIDKLRTTQGDNQVLKYQYRILVSSYKPEAVKLQVWDRLPHTETEAVSVSLVKAAPEVSTDALFVREARPNNLLRWDLTVEPAMNGEKAMAVNYEFKLELGRQMTFSNFLNFAPSASRPGF